MSTLLELLTNEDVSTFNETRGERQKVDLFAADLANKSLRSVDLSGADVEKADLTESDLTDAGLYKARMSGIDGTSMKLVDCLGARIKLREAWLDQADLSGSDFSNGDLTEAVVTNTRGQSLRLTSAKLKAVDAKGAQWPDVDLAGAHLSKSDFTGADLTRADLSEATGGELVMAQVKLPQSVAVNARLPGVVLTGADLTGARWTGANLSEADLTGADLKGADLTGANLAGAILAGANLTGCVLAEASLEGVDLSGLDLTDVDLTGHDADLLGLSDAQRDAVLSIGIPLNPDARLKPNAPHAARHGDLVVAMWENDDGEELTTLRYAARTPKGVTHGILPVVASSVLARTLVANQRGVQAILLRDRPGGTTIERFLFDGSGKLAGTRQVPLGYQPSIAPVVLPDGPSIRMWGIARRGPTLVITAAGEEGLQPVASKALPTARGFLGRQPMLACKGDVLMPCTRTGPGNPLASPEGYPGKLANAANDGDGRWFTVWVDPPAGRDKGGICGAWLVKRGSPTPTRVTTHGAVLSLDCCAYDGRVWIAWVEMHGLGDTRAFVSAVPEDLDEKLSPRQIDVPDVDHIAFAVAVAQRPHLVLTTDEERITFVSLDGKNLGALEG